MADNAAAKTIRSVQYDVIGTDAGNRGMKSLIVDNDLQQSAYVLAKLAKRSTVIVLSGFPCCVTQDPPTETDGPPGTYAIARAAYALGHNVIVVTDTCNEAVYQAALENLSLPNLSEDATDDESKQTPISLQVFPSTLHDDDEQRLQQLIKACDLVVSCERAGPGKDGICYTMRGINMNEKGLIAPLHRFVTERKGKDRVPFIAIGDGGNELGMGKVLSKIIDNPKIPKGELIGCAISADYLISASVSNWGGYALAATAALAKAESESSGDKTREGLLLHWVNQCVPTEKEEIDLLNRCVAAGCRDGVSGKMEATVDGMPLETSLQCLRDIRSTVLACEL